MEGTLSFQKLNNMAPPNLRNTRALKLVHRAQQWNAGEVRAFISLHYPNASPTLYPGPRAKTLSEKVKADMLNEGLDKSLSEALWVLKHAPDAALTMTVSTFNVSETMRGLGYATSIIGSVGKTDEEVTKTIGNSLQKGYDGSEFPKTNPKGYVKFTHPVEGVIVLPICGQQINTNYLKHPKIKRLVYSQQIAEGCELMATFFSFRNGEVVSVQAEEAGRELMNFGGVLAPNYGNGVGYLMLQIGNLVTGSSCPDIRGWKNVTLHGTAFAHAIYIAVTGKLAIDTSYIEEFISLTNSIVPSFLEINGSNITISGASLSWPKVIGNQMVDLPGKKANLLQAYLSLHVSRGFRGENKGARGEMTRAAYIGFNLSALLAEISYLLTNLRKFKLKGDVIVRTGESGSIGTLIMFLDVLTILNFSQVVVLPDSVAVRNLLQERKGSDVKLKYKHYRYGESQFSVVLASSISTYCDKGTYIYKEGSKFYAPEDAIIFDLRPLPMDSFSKTKYTEFFDKLTTNYTEMLAEWENWSWPVIGRARIVADMFKQNKVVCYSGLEIHNMVAWVTYGLDKVDVPMCYVIDSPEVITEVCAASIVANILRCMKAPLRIPVISALRQMGYTAVMPDIRGLGKVTMKSAFYARSDIQQAIDAGPAAVVELFKTADSVTRAMMLSDERTSKVIVTDEITPVKRDEKGITTTSKIDLSSFKNVDEDTTTVEFEETEEGEV